MNQSVFEWFLLGDSVLQYMLRLSEFSSPFRAEAGWGRGFAVLSVVSLATCWLLSSELWLPCFCPGHAAGGRCWSLRLAWLACVLSAWPETKVPLWWPGPWRLAATWLQSHFVSAWGFLPSWTVNITCNPPPASRKLWTLCVTWMPRAAQEGQPRLCLSTWKPNMPCKPVSPTFTNRSRAAQLIQQTCPWWDFSQGRRPGLSPS